MRSIRALEGDNNNKEVYSKIEARPMDKCESQTHQRKAVAGARTAVETTCREERDEMGIDRRADTQSRNTEARSSRRIAYMGVVAADSEVTGS